MCSTFLCLVVARNPARAWDYGTQGNAAPAQPAAAARGRGGAPSTLLVPAATLPWGAGVQPAQSHPPPRPALLPEKALGGYRASLGGTGSPGLGGSCSFGHTLPGSWETFCLREDKRTHCMVGQPGHFNEIQSYSVSPKKGSMGSGMASGKCTGARSP